MCYNTAKLSGSCACAVKCEHPSVILHPYAKSFFVKYGKFVYNGNIIPDFSTFSRGYRSKIYEKWYKQFVSPFFKKYKDHPEASFDQESLFLDYHFIGSDGVLYPFFILVPCGKCSVCSYTRLNDISARCELETFTSKCQPLFVTLTYHNDHLPQDGSVSLSDIQNFLKLLRINLNRFFATPYYDDKGKLRYRDAKISLRYLYCSEYTPSFHRPHYHLLIWNVPYIPNGLSDYQKKFFSQRLIGCPYNDSESCVPNRFNMLNPFGRRCPLAGSLECDLGRIKGYETLKKLIWCSWKKGFIKCEVSRNAGKYVAKYIGKGCTVPEGHAPTFVHWSTRRGLGFEAFDSYFKDILQNNPSLTMLTFCDPKSGKLTKCVIPKYYRSLLSPSLSVLSQPFRADLESFHYLCCFYKHTCLKRYNFDPHEVKNMWKYVYNKFELFDHLCGLSVPPSGTHYERCVDAFVFKPSNLASEYALFTRLLDEIRSLYSVLMSYDLDSLHLQDILDYKVLSTLARIDYAKNNPKSLSKYRNKSNDFYSRMHGISLRYDFV